ncbi:MAG: hypothetical protein M1142_04335 [Patescibacteria group bacterium]|nr:hypothetical protein [Patescibacteria group bacterium]
MTGESGIEISPTELLDRPESSLSLAEQRQKLEQAIVELQGKTDEKLREVLGGFDTWINQQEQELVQEPGKEPYEWRADGNGWSYYRVQDGDNAVILSVKAHKSGDKDYLTILEKSNNSSETTQRDLGVTEIGYREESLRDSTEFSKQNQGYGGNFINYYPDIPEDQSTYGVEPKAAYGYDSYTGRKGSWTFDPERKIDVLDHAKRLKDLLSKAELYAIRSDRGNGDIKSATLVSKPV